MTCPTRLLSLSLLWLALLLCGGCGSNVLVSGGGGSTASSGSSSSGTTSGGSSASSSSSSSGGGAGGAGVCGGPQDVPCSPDEYCDLPGESCEGQGVCLPRPVGCDDDCPGVCGCDGQFYCNACGAFSAGVDVSSEPFCDSPGVEYRALLWLGGLDHLVIRKKDPIRDVCVTLFADWPMESTPGYEIVTPDGWGVSHAVITNHAADCDDWQVPPLGDQVSAEGGNGAISWQVPAGFYYPCELSIDLVLTFDAGLPWVAPLEPLVADAVMIEGDGCF